MQQPIGFTWQEYLDGACGKYSLQHALLCLGIPVSQGDVSKGTRVPEWLTRFTGVGSPGLIRAVRRFGCVPIEFMSTSAVEMKEFVDRSLIKQMPVILSVQGDDHWSVLAGRDGDRAYFWIDSADEDLIGSWTWKKIEHWIDNDQYYGLAIKSRRGEQLRHSLVPHFAEIWHALEDDDLREFWGFYLEDLLEGFDCPLFSKGVLSAEEFFDSYGETIAEAVSQQYLYADEDALEWEIGNYRTVARSHRLTLRKSGIPRAIALITAALTCIACLDG